MGIRKQGIITFNALNLLKKEKRMIE